MKNLFINRKLELEKLVNGLKSNNDFVLVAPRRFGKTALALKALDIIRTDPEFIILDIDLMKYSGGDIRSVAECIIEKSLHALGINGRLRKMGQPWVLTVLSLAVILISITAFTAYIANKYGQNDKKHGKHV